MVKVITLVVSSHPLIIDRKPKASWVHMSSRICMESTWVIIEYGTSQDTPCSKAGEDYHFNWVLICSKDQLENISMGENLYERSSGE
eukprot:12337315-Ditylum_brightwellii.AAC.1